MKELAPDGATLDLAVVTIARPEMTRRARQTGSENADEFISLVPLGYLAEADSIGKAALFLASDDSAYITGHNLVVDGGLTLR